jgi:hypothetical protein
MSIPTKADGDLANVDSIASNVLTTLRTMLHANPRDLPGMRATLREHLQNYVDAAMAIADERAGG